MHRQKTSQESKGQSLVEFALGMTVIILLLSGIVDFGRAFFTYMTLRDAVQEGALYGSLNPSNSAGIASRVHGIANAPIDMNQVVVTSNPNPLGAPLCAGTRLEVTASYPFPLGMPFIGAIVGSQTITLTASVQNYILVPPCS